MVKALIILVLSVISGVLYRAGGSDKTWHGKERDWGVSLVTLVALAFLLRPEFNLKLIIVFSAVFLTSWVSLSSYWRWINPKADGVKAINWFVHGVGVALACLPLIWLGVAWWLILARAVLLGLTMMAVSELSEDVFVEELSRGILVVISLPLLVAG